MALFDFFKTKQFKEEIGKLKTENERLNTLLSPEQQEAMSLQERLDKLNREIAGATARHDEELAQYSSKIHNAEIRLADLTKQAATKQSSIIRLEETLELEDFALYRPRFSFTHASEYKDRLDLVREQQKAMLKNNTAASGNFGWVVNNSASQGKKLVNDMIKLCLRSFNNEAEAAVEDVRFNNYDRCEARIQKAAQAIERLGKIMSVSISYAYISLKIEELRLALEYQQKKQEEKEEQRAIREEQREAAKLRKELEEARKLVEKEKRHYTNALATIRSALASCTNEEERSLLLERENDLQNHLDEVAKTIENIDYREANQRAGYVYVISNIGSFGEGVYKIGMTRRLEPQERVDELGDASVPFYFDIHAMIFSDDAPKLEAALHQAFSDRRVNTVNTRREYFRVSLDEIEAVVKANHDKVVEFVKEPAAEQYRESLILSKAPRTRVCLKTRIV